MSLTSDSEVILMLCSHLGLGGQPEPAPLTLKDWNPLAAAIRKSSLARPGALLGMSAEDMARELAIEPQEAERCAGLLSRGAVLAIELERLQTRGIWVLTRADEAYPVRYRQRLGLSAPAVLFGAGEIALLGQPGLAIVGSRHLTPHLEEVARAIGNLCGRSGLVLYSGGAKGVDSLSANAALEGAGYSVGVLAHSLEAAVRSPEARDAIAKGDLALITPYAPDAGFSVGGAMGRNKLIYALADYGLVVSSDREKGGTWSGAVEALGKAWVPVFVLDGDDVPDGNRALLEKGALPFPARAINADLKLDEWLPAHAAPPPTKVVQGKLF